MDPDDRVHAIPGYLAGPGDPDAALEQFLSDHAAWSRYRPAGGDTTVLVSDDLLFRVQLDHEPDLNDQIRWTIVEGASPVGDLVWRATFDAATPHEIPMAVARALTATFHGFDPTRLHVASDGYASKQTVGEYLRNEGWSVADDGDAMAFRNLDGSAVLSQHDLAPFLDEPGGEATWNFATATDLHAGPPSTSEHHWHAAFSASAPAYRVLAALHELIEPMPAKRRSTELPQTLREHVTTQPAPTALRSSAASRRTIETSPALGSPAEASSVTPPTMPPGPATQRHS
ncbi:DUF317 domain-containing protein [Kitasatospora sp. NPDC048538]|uniref:DUF317 domain-containing protein n=1 Tax=Kitasatospora sp. NPDC048538 TaxID=3155633 RepID=UPI0033E0FAAC